MKKDKGKENRGSKSKGRREQKRGGIWKWK